MNNIEIRNITTEIRSIEEGSRKISGLAIPVNSRSGLLYNEFYETIAPEALEGVVEKYDVKLYINHDMTQGTYGRSKYGKGSLHLFVTERGLEFDTELPNTAQGDMLLEGIKRNDFDALSFAFVPDKDEWRMNEDGTYERTILSFSYLDEISILSMTPAYESTEVKLRSLEDFKEQQRKEEEERKLTIFNKLDAKLKEIEDIKI